MAGRKGKSGVYKRTSEQTEILRQRMKLFPRAFSGFHHSEEQKKKWSLMRKGKFLGKQYNHIGHKLSEETKRKIGEKNKISLLGNIPWNRGMKGYLEGDKHYNWKGGKIRNERRKLMQRYDYRIWRVAVFTRDNYTCQICNKKGGYFEADHIKPFSLYPELRYAIDNGRTLCKLCHMKTETWGYRKIYREV